ncbi:MAG: DUF4466 family protein [Bacteroidales bacterium]|nr:DUF4466 family protein [Bacteroidales bacterium]
MQNKYIKLALLMVFVIFLNACKEEEYALPSPKSGLNNDVIKRSIGPNLAGQNLEFAYAMALPQAEGKIVSAQVEATIAGATGTYMEKRSFFTNSSGVDVGILVADTAITEGNKTAVNFTRDTCAATLRYFYKIPDEAKGQEISFTFTSTASNGQTATYKMGPYTITKMDMALDLNVSNNNMCYISIENMAVYNATDAALNADKIDLVYLFRNITGITFGHALVAPATSAEYLDGLVLPAGVTNDAQIKKVWALRDKHLARLQYGIYVDDIDFVKLDLTGAPNYALNLKAESGIWIETANKKYRAYVYVNAVNAAGTAKISIKRYMMN